MALQWHYSGTTVAPQWHHSGTTVAPQWHHSDHSDTALTPQCTLGLTLQFTAAAGNSFRGALFDGLRPTRTLPLFDLHHWEVSVMMGSVIIAQCHRDGGQCDNGQCAHHTVAVLNSD